jgi:hypothetical protein
MILGINDNKRYTEEFYPELRGLDFDLGRLTGSKKDFLNKKILANNIEIGIV